MNIILSLMVIFLVNLIIIFARKNKWKNKKIPEKITIFNLGSSHGYFAFKYDKINGGGG